MGCAAHTGSEDSIIRATVALAMAGAPIAAIGSMATQTKRQTKFAELDAWLKKQGY